MRIRAILWILLLCTGWQFTSPLSGVCRAEILKIAEFYENDSPETARIHLLKALPATDEEKAFVLFYKAMLITDGALAKGFLQQICDLYPKQPITQKAYLELGHIHLLDRDCSSALSTYRKITDPAMPEKSYWIANTQYQMGDYALAIKSAETFLPSSRLTSMTEDAYFLIADAYINLDQYNNAVISLNKLKSLQQELNDPQYFHYRIGYALERLGNKSEAIIHYRQGYEANRFSQMAYLIEDRLFELRGKLGTAVDLAFLYPFSDAPLPDIVLSEPAITNKLNDAVVTPVIEPTPKSGSVQLEKAPEKGLYLQAGRFSSKANAVKLSDKIVAMGYPCMYYKTEKYKDVSWVVICGSFDTTVVANDAMAALKTNNIDCFIIQR